MSAESEIPAPFYRGKVRDLYAVDDARMLIVASDRISAFDVVFPEPIPEKGRLLNSISGMWFRALRNTPLPRELGFGDQMITDDCRQFPEPFCNRDEFCNRSALVRRAQRVDFECVVRGYLAGSGWKDYQATGAVCGHALPPGLRQAERLPAPIFTPATKAEIGQHDENVTIERMETALGPELARKLERISLALYSFAAEKMRRAGILLSDTKFEFGLLDGEVILIDEALTPDSSRYWDAASYEIGISPPGYDKQYIRDYVEQLGWNKSPPAPSLPPAVVQKTLALYREIELRVRSALSDLL